MNIVWTVVTVVALVALTITNPQSVLTVCLDSSAQALTTALGLCGVYCLWLGIFNVAEKCKLVEALAKCFSRLNKWLYGNIEKEAESYISLNLASNLLGVGNAATPSAISAINVLEKGETLSRSGAMLFVINATSVQLIPTTVIGLRASMGSANPSDILLPNLLSTIVTSIVGVALVFACYGKAKPTNADNLQTTPVRTAIGTAHCKAKISNADTQYITCPTGEATTTARGKR